MPNLRQLEILVAIADTRHFRKAATRASTTQPNVSEQLKIMEERLGCQLVERSRSGVFLTPMGDQIVERARRVLTEVSDIKTLAARGNEPLTGLVRLGIPPTVGPYLLPFIAPALHKQFPDLKLYLQEDRPSKLPHLLAEGTLDAIITVLPFKQPRYKNIFRIESLFDEPLHLTVAQDHKLAQTLPPLDPKALFDESVLTLGPGQQLHDTVQKVCEEVGANLLTDFEGTSLDTLREMVIMGMGITFLPGLYVSREIKMDPNLVLLPLEGTTLKRRICLVWRKTSARGTDFEKLTDFIKNHVEADLLTGAVSKLAQEN